MAKYHVKKDGMPGPCRAKDGNCPLGSSDEHYETKLEAILAAEEKMREENNFLVSVKKHKVFHVSDKGAVEECVYRDGYCEVKPFNKFNNLHSSDEAAIDGAARAFREVQGETEPELEQAKKETRPEPKPEAKPVPSSDPVTNQARGVINDGYNRLRDEGWKEEDIQHYRDSCGHMAVPDYVRKKNPAKYPPRGYSC